MLRSLALLLVLSTPLAFGQVDAVDPDNPKEPEGEKPSLDNLPTDGTAVVDEDEDAPPPEVIKAPVAKADAGVRAVGKKAVDPKKPVEPPPPPLPPPPILVITRATDADLDAAWERWRVANAANDPKGEPAARAELIKLKHEVGASDLEAYSQGLLRAAGGHEAAGDSAGAINLGLAAVEVAPNVPATRFGLARLYFAVDPSGVGRIFDALKGGVVRTATDPRYLRPVLADLATAFLTALTALAVVVLIGLFARRVRYFLYDFHFVFPRALARWQSTAIAVLLLLVPVVFQLGVAPALLVAFAAVALYLTVTERVVAAVLVGMLGVIPTLGALAVRETSFAGTDAEVAYLLEQGGPGSEALAQRFTRRAAADKAGFAELFALGRFELRRGKLNLAVPHLKGALLKKPGDARASTNLAVAMLLTGDLENPRQLLEDAATADPTLSAPLFNQARLFQRRLAVLGPAMAKDVDQGTIALGKARALDPNLRDARELAPGEKLDANLFLIAPPMATEDLIGLSRSLDAEEKVLAQLTSSLIGDVPELLAPFFAAVVALLLLGVGFLARSLDASRPCSRCGAPVSHRGDRELPQGSAMCTQCVNVFARKGVVPPALKVRKQLEVSRYATRLERVTYAFGVVCSGLGHIFSGKVLQGAAYAFLFLIVIVLFVQRHGVLRSPYETVPMLVRVVPLALVFLSVYLLSLRGLFRKG